jgi:uncharacterized protein (TIGR03435 family)
MRLWRVVTNLTLVPGFGQASADAAAAATVHPIQFDVVSIRPNKSVNSPTYNRLSKDGFALENVSLTDILTYAYYIRRDLITAPSWTETASFDVMAKVSGEDVAGYQALPQRQKYALLQSVLADRFHLQAHVATKEMPGYALTIATGGPKMKVAAVDASGYGASDININADSMNMAMLATLLSQVLHRTVTDSTGLPGRYVVKLRWSPDVSTGAGSVGGATDAGPTIFTALTETLGLKLVPNKGPVDTLVVDHIEMPTEN